jgi:hypothetical protein
MLNVIHDGNWVLFQLLKNRLGYDIPQWLEDDLKDFADHTENEDREEK